VSLPEIDMSEKSLLLLAQTRYEEMRKDLPQIFQSCTFNRSVTSPLMHASMRTEKRWDINAFLIAYLTAA
jgi:hypothetical protein